MTAGGISMTRWRYLPEPENPDHGLSEVVKPRAARAEGSTSPGSRYSRCLAMAPRLDGSVSAETRDPQVVGVCWDSFYDIPLPPPLAPGNSGPMWSKIDVQCHAVGH